MGVSVREKVKGSGKLKCPKCSKQTGAIIYGMPTIEAFEKAERGEFRLGGCVIEKNQPEYYCKSCECEFRTKGGE